MKVGSVVFGMRLLFASSCSFETVGWMRWMSRIDRIGLIWEDGLKEWSGGAGRVIE